MNLSEIHNYIINLVVILIGLFVLCIGIVNFINRNKKD